MSAATVARVDRRFLRGGWILGHLLVLLAVLVCLRLGWWQWDRSQDIDGDAQNLGYAMLWPVFGAGFIYMWIRFLHLELQRDDADDQDLQDGLQDLLADGETGAAQDAGSSSSGEPGSSQQPDDAERATDSAGQDGEPPSASASPVDGADADAAADQDDPTDDDPTFVGMVHVTDEEDPELAAYNRALAAIAEEDRKRAR